jgi:Leucine-rich repeat (LRR) protein
MVLWYNRFQNDTLFFAKQASANREDFMNQTFCVFLAIIFMDLSALTGCGDDLDGNGDASANTDTNPCAGVIAFPDANLEAAIRNAINKPLGDIVYEDVAGLTSLDASVREISDLTNVQCLNKLTKLYLYSNQISDLSPLSTLTGLTELWLDNNQIADVSPLGNLTGLTEIIVSFNSISDVSPLSTLTGLTELYLDWNQISDVSPLSTLTGLTSLVLDWNQISDVSPLSALTNLGVLILQSNQISDVSALVENTGLRDGDEVDITDNPLNCNDAATMADLQTLLDRGVDLSDDCHQS